MKPRKLKSTEAKRFCSLIGFDIRRGGDCHPDDWTWGVWDNLEDDIWTTDTYETAPEAANVLAVHLLSKIFTQTPFNPKSVWDWHSLYHAQHEMLHHWSFIQVKQEDEAINMRRAQFRAMFLQQRTDFEGKRAEVRKTIPEEYQIKEDA